MERPAPELLGVPPRAPSPLRRWFRKAMKPFLVAGIAGLLAVSMTVTTTQKAEANPLLIPAILLPSGTMTVGSAVAAVSLTGPIGWGILGVAAVAVGLAATQEYWLPYVRGDWGKEEPSPDTTSGYDKGYGTELQNPTPNLAIQNNVQMGTSGLNGSALIRADFNYVGTSTTDFYGATELHANCQRPDGSRYQEVVRSEGKKFNANNRYQITNTPNFCMKTPKPNANDVTGPWPDKLVGARSVPLRKAVNTATPVNGITFYTPATGSAETGDMSTQAGKPGFDPTSPDVKYQTTVECVRADGTFFSISAESTGADDGKIKMPACAAVDPDSHATGKIDVIGTAPGTEEKTPLWNNPRIPASPEYPLCAPSRPGPMCQLRVTVDGKPCVDAVGTWNCANWREIANQDATRVQCSYGPYTGLAVDVCNPMERAYESPDGTLATEENLDGDPSTRNDATTAGQPYSKPRTSTGTGTSTFPGSGTNPSSQPGQQGENCWSQGWSWNPVSWVMVPVSCALQWAFVPPQASLEATTRAIQPKLEAKGIEPFVTPFMANFGNVGGSGCKGPAINLGSIGIQQTLYPFDACTEPLAPIASGVNSFFMLAIILQGGTSCIRAIATGFGFNWGFGKDDD